MFKSFSKAIGTTPRGEYIDWAGLVGRNCFYEVHISQVVSTVYDEIKKEPIARKLTSGGCGKGEKTQTWLSFLKLQFDSYKRRQRVFQWLEYQLREDHQEQPATLRGWTQKGNKTSERYHKSATSTQQKRR